MAWRDVASLTSLLLVSFLWSGDSLSYPTPVDFDGKLLRWNIQPGETILYTFEAPSDRRELLATITQSAAERWNEVPKSFARLAYTDSGGLAHITIDFDAEVESSSYSSGYAVFDNTSDDGPVHCTIKVVGGSTSLIGIAKTVLHEFGHCLGLGHSLSPEAIMSYRLDRNSFALSLDDQAAISRLYPIDGKNPDMPPGCGVSSRDRARFHWLGPIVLLFPLCLCMGSMRFRENHPVVSHRKL